MAAVFHAMSPRLELLHRVGIPPLHTKRFLVSLTSGPRPPPIPLLPHAHQATHTCFCAGAHTHRAGRESGNSDVHLGSPHLSAGGHGFGTENSAGSGNESGTRSGSGSVHGGQNGSNLHRDGSGS